MGIVLDCPIVTIEIDRRVNSTNDPANKFSITIAEKSHDSRR